MPQIIVPSHSRCPKCGRRRKNELQEFPHKSLLIATCKNPHCDHKTTETVLVLLHQPAATQEEPCCQN